MNRLKQVVLLVFAGMLLAILTEAGRAYQVGQKSNPPAAAASTESPSAPSAPNARNYNAKYDHFDDQKVNRSAAVESHNQLTVGQRCDVCHARTDDSPEPDRPYHDDCIQCHAMQFVSPKLEICVSCHPQPIKSDKEGITKFYGFPKELNQFGMEFSHNTHAKRANWDCNTCHKTPADRKTVRSSFPDHPECYTCHKAVNQPAKGNCNECHNKAAQAYKFHLEDREQISLAYDYFKFTHGSHLVTSSVNNRCEVCHDVVNTDAQKSPDISRIKLVLTTNPTLIHKSLCFKCHNPNPNQAAGEKCEKCHVKPVGSLATNPPKGYKKP